ASQPQLALQKLGAGEPVGRDDAGVQGLFRLVVAHRSGEGKAQRVAAVTGIAPQVGADQGARLEAPRGLLAGLANDGFEERLTVLDVARRLVEHEFVVDAFLDDQEAAVVFRDGRDGDLRLVRHARKYIRATRV